MQGYAYDEALEGGVDLIVGGAFGQEGTHCGMEALCVDASVFNLHEDAFLGI